MAMEGPSGWLEELKYQLLAASFVEEGEALRWSIKSACVITCHIVISKYALSALLALHLQTAEHVGTPNTAMTCE